MHLRNKHRFFYYFLVAIVFSQWPLCSAYAANRTIMDYALSNILLQLLISGGYYTLGTLGVVVLLSLIYKEFRTYALSIFIAFCFLYFLILVYEVLESTSWLPTYG